ncbi:phosphoserine phosphatase [Agrilus planipennis]|uniref:Phosphoserine phosphatase n=1 Tax=Agrilus planipennis TaxID=224129 RepID=A0A1W4XNK7_AGRPL|nr:phosphoserine phosphatase [Agrilus planipennis]
MSSDEIQNVWRQTDAVCFDVDSTVIQEEGIDELAGFLGKGNEIARLTREAMSGDMTFRQSLNIRLNILQPTLVQIRDFVRTKPPTLTPGIKKLVDVLHSRNVPVFLVSGGFKCFISPIASKLNIPIENVFCNRLKFYYTGEYAGFDENAFTSESGGKGLVVNYLKQTFGFKKLVMIGDGMTDLEASPPADAFIGYGGNIIREKVKAKSKWYVTDFNELIGLLKEK